MSGTTSVAPAMDSAFSARRSYSSPDLLSLPALHTGASESLSLNKSMSQLHLLLDDDEDDDDNHHPSTGTATDTESLPSFSDFEIPSFNTDFELGTLFLDGQRSQSDGRANPAAPVKASPTQRRNTAPLPFARPTITSPTNLHESWTSGSKATEESSERGQRRAIKSSEGKLPADGQPRFSDQLQPQPLSRRQKSIDNLRNAAKLSWMSSSRSSSPKSRPGSPVDKSSKQETPITSQGKMKQSIAPKQLELLIDQSKQDATLDTSKSSSKSFTRYFSKIKGKSTGSPARSQEALASNLSRASSAVSLGQAASSSIDTHASHSTSSDTNLSTPSTLDDFPTDLLPRMLDPLWSTFKTLEMEVKGFAAKATQAKIAQVQTLILPFLKGASGQSPIGNLRPEDVDRRATVLNKWWGAILDALEGQHKQTVPSVDRPILLEAATLIMKRSEWRQTTSYFLPLAERSPKERVQSRSRTWTNASDTSESSSQSAMLAESAEHNVRTMFVANLIRQMAFVVDKMSLRHAPMSMVNFAGKTCAYAFFFAPGVSDILVRLWALTPELIRRAGDALRLPRKDSGESDDIVALFPPKLGALGWSSPRKMWETLRHIPKLPMLVARIPWTGPWVSRWKGRDTDLFFIFCKYFHCIADEFMPPGLPLTEKARAPAFVLLHAQLLSTIDTTIHRQMAGELPFSSSMADLAQGADASLAMPLPPSHLMKGMSENRLVILLKDVLSSDCAEIKGARHTFAEAFAAMLRAAAGRTPRYNSNACFTLCDFLEEVLTTYSDFETPENPTSYIEWDFWVDVCKMVMTSYNTMSEVRVLSFIYTIWDAMAKDPQKKLSLCREWLLSEETFNALFNNWCPMVRAYYQRLLCWRMCREKGLGNEVDTEIFLLATKRLKTSWSHYLYLKYSAEETGRAVPSAAPMSPTLGKKFIIIRQEVNTPQPGLLMGFDAPAKKFHQDLIPSDGFSDVGAAKKDDKKRWSLLGRMLSFTGAGSQGFSGDSYAGTTSTDDELRIARREVAESRLKPGSAAGSAKGLNSFDSGRSSPVFDEQKYVFKFVLGWQQPPMPPRERVLAHPRLPMPAQARISVRSPSASPLLPPMRRVPGVSPGGLVQEARNAGFLDVPPLEPRRNASSLSLHRLSDESAGDVSGTVTPKSDRLLSLSSVGSSGILFEAGEIVEAVTQPVQPGGIYLKTSVYIGRALAEWSLVVAECNNFVERRRDEGVGGLGDVEVPLLNVDGFRRAVG